MSKATTLPIHHRRRNYEYQDETTHHFIIRNCPTSFTPRQLKRMYKKMRSQYKVKSFTGYVNG